MNKMNRKNCWRIISVNWLHANDKGSGTFLGAILVAVAAIGLVVIASLGNIIVCKAKGRTAADSAVLAAASALQEGDSSPCDQAAKIAAINESELITCALQGKDVQVTVQVHTKVPFVSRVSVMARAGPEDCS